MDIRNRRGLKTTAAEALAANPGNPRLTVLAYIAFAAVSALLVSAVTHLLDDQIAGTTGLSGMGLRSILGTVQTVLPLVQTVALLGVQLGVQYAALSVIRRRAVEPRTLLEGFAHFGSLIRSILLQGLLYFLLSSGAMYAASFVFMLTPLSADFMELVAPLVTDSQAFYEALYNDTAFFNEVGAALIPVVPMFLLIFLAVAAPFYYQYRFTNYCLLEAPRVGALAAMGESARMLKGHRLQLLKLDLSFWWFYLGQMLVSVILYGDVLLPLVGVTLPWDPRVGYYVFYILSLALEGVLYYFFLNKVECTYAAAYESLCPKAQPSQGAVLGNIFDLAKEYFDENKE